MECTKFHISKQDQIIPSHVLVPEGEDGPGSGISQQAFFRVYDPFLIDTAVQHWLLATDRDCLDIGLS